MYSILDCQEFTPSQIEQMVSVCLAHLKTLEVNCSVNDYTLGTICAHAAALRTPSDSMDVDRHKDQYEQDDESEESARWIAPLQALYLRGNVKNISDGR
jgi:hypothetical protein